MTQTELPSAGKHKHLQISYKRAMSALVGGVVVITCYDRQHQPTGFTATSMTSVSVEPSIVSFCLQQQSSLSSTFAQAHEVGISLLSYQQNNIASVFARNSVERNQLEYYRFQEGIPVIDGSIASMTARVFTRILTGNSHLFLADVLSVDHKESEVEKLAYVDRQYVAV